MEDSGQSYNFKFKDVDFEGKHAYQWSTEKAYDQDKKFTVDAGTLIYYDGKFRFFKNAKSDLSYNQLGSIMGDTGTIITLADKTIVYDKDNFGSQINEPESQSTANIVFIDWENHKIWLRGDDGGLTPPTVSNHAKWYDITEMFPAVVWGTELPDPATVTATPTVTPTPVPTSSGNGYGIVQVKAWSGNKTYDIYFTNTTNEKMDSITVTLKVIGTITSIDGNVSGTIHGDTAEVTFNNYGNGISANSTIGPIYMHVAGTGEFSLE